MTRISKILVVVVLIASLTFLGFVIASTSGGPNWTAEMRELQDPGEFGGYEFTLSEAPPAKWTVKHSAVEQPVGSSPLAPAVVVSALKSATTKQQEQLTATKEAIETLEARKAAWTNNLATDVAALEARRVELLALLEKRHQYAVEMATNVTKRTEEAQKIEQRIGERRDDVLRLKSQLAEIRADEFRLQELRTELTDQLQQVTENLDRARQRARSLETTAVNP